MLMEDFTFPLFKETSVHTGKVGESLLDLSKKYYGNHENWHLIAKINNIIDPWQDIVGLKLIIPKYE